MDNIKTGASVIAMIAASLSWVTLLGSAVIWVIAWAFKLDTSIDFASVFWFSLLAQIGSALLLSFIAHSAKN